jgi:DNA-directed RNA polymerase subunit RPC12/RpoP
MNDSKTYICKYCGKEFDTPQKLGGHIIHCKMNPNYDKNKLSCNNFTKVNNDRKLDTTIYYCQYCGKECKGKNSLVQHEIRCKENPNKINLEYLSNRDYSNVNFNPSNQFIKAKKLGLPIPEVSEETRKKLGKGWRDKHLPDEMKNKISLTMKRVVKEKPESYNGVNINGKVKKYDYNGIKLDGSWELLVAQYLDFNNIKWERPRKGFEYIWNNDIHIYYPDFYLIDYNVYIEVKGFETERDYIKWESLSNLIIIKRKEIIDIKNSQYNIFNYLGS